MIRESLFELKQFIHKYEFKDQGEKIWFFKEIKLKFLSLYFYHDKLLSILIKTSLMDVTRKTKYYRKMLKHIQKFQKRDNDWITSSSHIDDKFYNRTVHWSEDPNLDDSFSTGYDVETAVFEANEKIKKYLLNEMSRLESNKAVDTSLTWTGPKVSLVELIYGLQAVGVFNNATADIKHIVTVFEKTFNTDLGNYYRTLQDIRLRKNGTTYFLDSMKEKLEMRLKEIDDL